MPEFSQQVFELLQRRNAVEQGGLLSAKDPTAFDAGDPIRLWIVQVGVIICTASLLALGLRKLHQPKVIAEVLGGIILGPTAFGRIPGFTEHVFPLESRSYLGLVANIGLCLFLFLVGLEIDAGVIKRNARLSATVAIAGMALPFAIGAGLASAIYKEFIDPNVQFTHFMLFTGVAYSITAFPVLCRILTELKLLDTTVGIVVLSAGVGNDIIGWTLLALSVALVNAGTGLTALYILLVCVGWTLVVLFPIRWALKWIARTTGSIESGPTVFFMTVTMLVLFGSAFFTDIIGVHAIFGAFLAGLIVPREGGLAIALTEKLEDMVTIIFLPLYFTLSGLSTDLGLLDSGKVWAYTIAVIVTAFLGKFGGCSLSARYAAGFNWRESAAIGSLMSCKGLVELIVLNVGLSAGILSRRVFSMFVLEALVLTFVTTPLVTWVYPPHTRTRIAASGSNFKSLSDSETGEGEPAYPRTAEGARKTRFTVILDKFEHLAGMMALTQLVTPTSSRKPSPSSQEKQPSSSSDIPSLKFTDKAVSVEALRVIELSDRVSAVMKSSAADAVLHSDPLLSAFRMFGGLNQIKIDPSLLIVSFDQLAYSISEQAKNYGSDMILLPWLTGGLDTFTNPHQPQSAPIPPPMSAHSHHDPHLPGPATPKSAPALLTPKTPSQNPFDALFKGAAPQASSASIIHSQFVRSVFSQAATDVALFVDLAMLDTIGLDGSGKKRHLFLPFFGGPDDRLALEFVVQLCENPGVQATVVRIMKREDGNGGERSGRWEDVNALTMGSHLAGGYQDTFYSQSNSESRLQSDTADNVLWATYAGIGTVTHRHPRIEFSEVGSLAPLHMAIYEAQRCLYGGTDLHSPTSPGEDETQGADLGHRDSDEGLKVTVDDTAVVASAGQDSGGTVSPADDANGTNGSVDSSILIRVQQPSDVGHDASARNSVTFVTPHPHPSLLLSPVSPSTSSDPNSPSPVSPLGPGGLSPLSPSHSSTQLQAPLIIITGRSRRLAVEDHRAELKDLMDEHGSLGAEVRKTIGDVASGFVVAGVGSGVVVMQKAEGTHE